MIRSVFGASCGTQKLCTRGRARARGQPRGRRRRGPALALVAVLAVGVTVLVISALRDTLVYYRTPSEVASAPPAPGERIRLGGTVLPGSLHETAGQAVFHLGDGHGQITVIQHGAAPGTFAEGRKAVVEGVLGNDGVFVVRHRHGQALQRVPARPGIVVTGQLGTLALAAGIAIAVAATLLWLRVALASGPQPDSDRGDPDPVPGHPASVDVATRRARQATLAVFVPASAACLLLEYALVTRDFSVRYVAENGGGHTPLYYTVTGLWAAQAGSLLLWLLILTGYGALLARTVPPAAPGLHPWAMTGVSAVTVFFFALSHFGADPFQAVHPVPTAGPNPLLAEHPAMGLHPPLLYAGYVGLACRSGTPSRPWSVATPAPAGPRRPGGGPWWPGPA